MADTTFLPGTTIASAWLNDVNDTVYGLRDTSVGTAGAAIVPFNPSLTYTSNTVGSALNQVPGINVKWFGVVGDGATVQTAAIQALIDLAASVNRPLIFPNGTYITGSLNFIDKRVSILGESVLGTTLKAIPAFTGTLISMLNTTNNGGDTFERIENITIEGVYGVGSVGVDQALCSRAVAVNVRVRGFDIGIRRVNCFCMYDENVESNDCRIDLHLVGSNHNSAHVRCSYVGAGASWGGTGECVRITNNGADSLQSSLSFHTCDFEFGGANADGVVASLTGTLLLENCYAEALGGTIIKMNDGHCDVMGGEWIVRDTTGFMTDVVGGGASITFDNGAVVTSDGVTRIYASIIKTAGAGTVTFLRTRIFEKLITNNNGTLPPNLGRSVLSAPFLRPVGRAFTKTDYTGVSTVLDTLDTRRVTCTTAGTTGVYQAFIQQPRINANCALVIAYRSNTSFEVTSVGGPGQAGTVTTIGTLPNSAGALSYAVFPMAKITVGTQLGMEFWKPAWAIGNYLELVECWWSDGGAITNGQLSLG